MCYLQFQIPEIAFAYANMQICSSSLSFLADFVPEKFSFTASIEENRMCYTLLVAK